ncbi:GTP-binding protein REM 1 [Moschus berezovskii]|uniref:GTP-binding protein REM 1 n=1 Tax=Moschus berezovskii TaxID=68408 RepID=UPI002444E611|nr:GTP-binding protein REM 1 [Moschus berezovskii]
MGRGWTGRGRGSSPGGWAGPGRGAALRGSGTAWSTRLLRPPRTLDPSPLQEDVYERTLTVDGEDTTLLVMDTWEAEKPDESWSQESCLQVGSAYVIVYSIADRGSFESASELRIQLRRTHQADHVPIILVGNKADLARCREVSVEEGRACAVVFDCKFIETSATLQHNVAELFEGVVRQLRLRRRDCAAGEPPAPRRRASLGQRARRFLARLTARSARRRALKARSKSCHNLAVL